MGEDIIAEMPWCCGESDCEAQWHQANYWSADEDGHYSVDTYADGDHEDCEASEVPGPDEVAEGWRSYACWVIETGTDVLGQYAARWCSKDRQAWEFKFEPSPAGTVVTRARRVGQEHELTNLHERVLQYLGIDKDTLPYVVGHPLVMGGDFGAEALHKAGLGYRKWNRIVIEITVERDAELVSRELRRLARRHLKATKQP